MPGFFSSRPNWPLNRRRWCPPSFGSGGGGNTFACRWGGHFTELMWPRKVTLRSKKISIKWLWSVKVTLKVIKRRLLVFCWSCDGVPLKWNKKNSEPPVCPYKSIEPNLASQFEWSVNTFNQIKYTRKVVVNHHALVFLTLYSALGFHLRVLQWKSWKINQHFTKTIRNLSDVTKEILSSSIAQIQYKNTIWKDL